jgi:hypothetical protein
MRKGRGLSRTRLHQWMREVRLVGGKLTALRERLRKGVRE